MKITLKELLKQEGLTLDEMIEEYGYESIVPACCDEGCQVEPDGICEHGGKSFILQLGFI